MLILRECSTKFHHGSLQGTSTGVGLGLPICRAIVRLHGGRVWAERVPAGGSAFRFTLPLEESPPVPMERARIDMADPRPTILIIEDEPAMRHFLRAAFDFGGYKVIESPTGRRGSVDAGTQQARSRHR